MLPGIFVFLIVLSLLVFIHELGHFLVAKKTGIMVEEFGFGYPPRIWGKKIGNTVYSINWIPFGGFVKLLGQEARDKKNLPAKVHNCVYFSKPKKIKAAVLLAGITGNFLLGVFCFAIIYSKLGIPQKLNYVKIADVVEGAPAADSGLQKDDKVFAINDKKVAEISDFAKVVEEHKGQQIVVQTERGDFTVISRENPPEGEGRLGILITDTTQVFYPWWQMPFLGAWAGLKEALGWGIMVVLGLVLTIKQIFAGIAPQVAGPVGIYQLTTIAAKQGILELIQFVGMLSVNLAVLNLLPFPALDGGHLVFLYLGDILGEKRKEKVEHIFNLVGFVILLSLMVLITINDILRILKTSPFFTKLFSFLPF